MDRHRTDHQRATDPQRPRHPPAAVALFALLLVSGPAFAACSGAHGAAPAARPRRRRLAKRDAVDAP